MSEHKRSRPEIGIVTSDAIHAEKRSPIKRFWLPGAIVLVLALGVAGGLLYKYYIYDPAHKGTLVTSNKTQPDALKRFDVAVADSKTRVQRAQTKSQKASAYVALGIAYANKNQNKDAITALNTAIATDSSIKVEALSVLAYAYDYDGQRDKAIRTFQELIALLQKQGPEDASARTQAYQNDLQQLQEGKSL